MMAPHLKINFVVYRLTVENFMRLSQFAQFFSFTELNCYTIPHILTHSVNLCFGLNRASKTNVGLGPGSGFKMKPIYSSGKDVAYHDQVKTVLDICKDETMS